jgi:hypothetical protein
MKKVASFLVTWCFFLSSCSHKQTTAPTERLAWHTQTMVKAYDSVGRHDPKWDESAHNALSRFAQVRSGKERVETGGPAIGLATQEAVAAGCDDPLIRYVYLRYAPDYDTNLLSFWQNEFGKAARDLEASSYSPFLKFYANDRAALVLWENNDQKRWDEVVQFRRAAMNNLAVALQDKSVPVEDVSDAVGLLIETISANEKEMKDAYNQIQGPLFQNWGNSAAAYFIKGRFNYEFAWRARGGGYANGVSEESWKTFHEDLAVAETAYRKAWNLNPHDVRIPAQMIEMAVSQEKDRDEMELWFQRAMKLDTNNFSACLKKLRYLNPKWYGSRDDMVAFGKECVASSKWGGDVPLTLVEAHWQYQQLLEEQDRRDYWRLPDVWPDIQAGYEKYFKLNPNATTKNRYPYAWYAFQCGKLKDFTYQIKLIRDVDGTLKTSYFGGDDKFSKMVEAANAQAPAN